MLLSSEFSACWVSDVASTPLGLGLPSFHLKLDEFDTTPVYGMMMWHMLSYQN
jgi:hypothetical protein